MKKRKSTESKATVAEAVASPKTSSQPPVEVIIRVGAEGGSWTLVGRRTKSPDGWEFAAELNEQYEYDDPIYGKSDWVSDWQSALKLYAKYPWHSLYPLEVHKEFRAAVEVAV